MKKRFIIAIILFSLGALTLTRVATYGVNAQQTKVAIDSLYPKTTIVAEIDEENNLVICEDYEGEAWVFEGVEDWQEGDFATLLMDDNDTEEIFDDEIVKIEYNGNVEGLK